MLPVPLHAPSVVHLLADAAKKEPHREALVCDAERLNYAQYADAVSAFAAELQALGVAGGRVALIMGNSIDHAIAAFAIQAARAQLVPLNPNYTAHEIGEILSDADPCLVVYDLALEKLTHSLPGLPGACRRIAVGRNQLAHAATHAPLPLPEPHARALLQYTGGTTGRSKGVELSHAAVAANVAQREAVLPTRAEDRVLVMTPLYHSYAMAMGLNLAVSAMSTLVILPRFEVGVAMDTVAKERVTLFCGSPTIFNAILSNPHATNAAWASLRLCYSGSAALPIATLARWETLTGCGICEGYGQTEAGPVLTYNPEFGVRKPGTVGITLPGTEIEVVDIDTGYERMRDGDAGEIRARGPQIMIGYRNRPVETNAALRDGWLYTGDIGTFDADRYLTISDRKKDMVIVSGFNVYPREVEEALIAHATVTDAAVIGRHDAHRGERLVAFIVLRPGAIHSDDEIANHLSARLARYKIPSEIHVVEALPKTAVGKTDKVKLRAQP